MSDNDFFDAPPIIYGKVSRNYLNCLLNGGFSRATSSDAKTQKARGIFFLQDRAEAVSRRFNWAVPKHLLFPAGYQFGDKSLNYPVFARPCPTVPRHGFVDSTVCRNAVELNALSRETSDVEPDAELLVTKPVDAHYNVIINGNVITFAPGNDGATSGNGCRYFYISDDPLSKHISLDPAILLEGEVPFYEIVISKEGYVRLVQVRSAPGTPRAKDFIPAPMVVKNIIKAEGDLLDWEAKVKSVDPSTTVVDHTNGSLSSHYAIHAIINNVPIFTTSVPNIGDMIEPTVENSEITDSDKKNFSRAFIAGFNSSPYLLKKLRYIGGVKENARPVMLEILHLALATLHNFSSLSMSKDYELLGIALGLFVRTCFSVSSGEARHSPKKDVFPEFHSEHSENREVCYNTMFAKSAEQCIKDIETIFYIFRDVYWSGGFGGPKWASCTESAINLFNAGVSGDITEVVELFNRVINEEHNGGRYLNKIISINNFDDATKDPSLYALQKLSGIVDVVYTAFEYMDNNREEWETTSSLFKRIELKPQVEVYGAPKPSKAKKPYAPWKTTVGGIKIPYEYKPDCTCGECALVTKKLSVISEAYLTSTEDGIWDQITAKIPGKFVNIKLSKILIDDAAYIGAVKPLVSGPYNWQTEEGLVVCGKAAATSKVKAMILKKGYNLKGAPSFAFTHSGSHIYEAVQVSLQKSEDGKYWKKAHLFSKNAGVSRVIGLAKPIEIPKGYSGGAITLKSILFWWAFPDGTKVVSKAAITNLLYSSYQKNGFTVTLTNKANSSWHSYKVSKFAPGGNYADLGSVSFQLDTPITKAGKWLKYSQHNLHKIGDWWCLPDGTEVVLNSEVEKAVKQLNESKKATTFEQDVLEIAAKLGSSSKKKYTSKKPSPFGGYSYATTFSDATNSTITFTSKANSSSKDVSKIIQDALNKGLKKIIK